MSIYVYVGLIIAFTGFIKGFSGFGTMLVAIPLLLIFYELRTIIPFIYIIGSFGTAGLLLFMIKHMHWKDLIPLVIGFLPGVIIGGYALKSLYPGTLQLILGIVLIAYSLYGFISDQAQLAIGNAWAYLIGLVSGLLGGAIGASGPPAIIYLSSQQWDKDRMKVSLQGFFLATNFISIGTFGFYGLITGEMLKLAAFSLPLFFIGIYAGSRLYDTLSDRAYHRIVLLLLMLLGIMTTVKALH